MQGTIEASQAIGVVYEPEAFPAAPANRPRWQVEILASELQTSGIVIVRPRSIIFVLLLESTEKARF